MSDGEKFYLWLGWCLGLLASLIWLFIVTG